ncbi:hypothetical protein Tco_0666997 [Tanacetum coccineum]
MVINSPCLDDKKELAILKQTATGKESTNPLMADSLPKTIMPTKLVKPQDFNLRPNIAEYGLSLDGSDNFKELVKTSFQVVGYCGCFVDWNRYEDQLMVLLKTGMRRSDILSTSVSSVLITFWSMMGIAHSAGIEVGLRRADKKYQLELKLFLAECVFQQMNSENLVIDSEMKEMELINLVGQVADVG